MKKEENYIKKGERGLKNASSWAIISKKISRGVFRPLDRELGKKMKKGKGKRRKITLKTGGKALKMHLFGL